MVPRPASRERAFLPPFLPLLLTPPQTIGGPEWEGRDRSYRVADFLLSFTDAFNGAIDRMVDKDPYNLAEDLTTLLEWQGGVRTFDAAMRLGTTTIPTVVSAEEKALKPLAAFGHLLELSGEARIAGTPFTAELAEVEKRKVRSRSGWGWSGADEAVVGERVLCGGEVRGERRRVRYRLDHPSDQRDLLDERCSGTDQDRDSPSVRRGCSLVTSDVLILAPS